MEDRGMLLLGIILSIGLIAVDVKSGRMPVGPIHVSQTGAPCQFWFSILLFGGAKSQLHKFGKCGHWTMIEQAARFQSLVSWSLSEGRWSDWAK